jgi:hypothetical protein
MSNYTQARILSALRKRRPDEEGMRHLVVSVPAGETAWAADLGLIEGPTVIRYEAVDKNVTAHIVTRP